MLPLIVQTGSVPALLHALRGRLASEGAVRVLAPDSENVRQYLSELNGVEARYFTTLREASALLARWSDSPSVYYLGGTSFRRLRNRVLRRFPKAQALVPEQAPDWDAFEQEFHGRLRRDSILLIQSEEVEFIAEYWRDVFPRHSFTRPSIRLLCRREDLPRWRRLHPEWRFWTLEPGQAAAQSNEETGAGRDAPGRVSPKRADGLRSRRIRYAAPVATMRLLRRQGFDAAVAFFTGHSGFRWAKALSLLCGARHRIVVNEHMQFTEVTVASIFWFACQRLWYGADRGGDTRVLIFQTWDQAGMQKILERLQAARPFYRPRYTLFTRQDNAGAFAGAPLISEVLTYPVGAGLRAYRHSLRQIRKMHFDAAVVTFTEEASYRKLKWLPFLAGIRHKLIFNRHGDCFFFTPGTLVNYWRSILANRRRYRGGTDQVLIVQTWDEGNMCRILDRLAQVRPFHKPRYTLFTRDDKAAVFRSALPMAEILTYSRGAGIAEYWRSLRRIRKMRFDAAVVAFTEEASYRKLKWLPFLAGIRHKLVFNRHGDCFFFTPGAFLGYWSRRYADDVRGLGLSLPQLFWMLSLPLVRAVLFPLRFLYLLIGVTWLKLRRAYALRSRPCR